VVKKLSPAVLGLGLVGVIVWIGIVPASPKNNVENSIMTRNVELPFYPPIGDISLYAYFHRHLGKEMFVIGRAFNSEMGPTVIVNTLPRAEASTIYIKDIGTSWSKEFEGKDISIVGLLQKKDKKWTLSHSSQRLLGDVYAINQLKTIQGFDQKPLDKLCDTVIMKLKEVGENPDDFYVHIDKDTHPQTLKVFLLHKDSLRPEHTRSIGNPSGKDRVIYYDVEKNEISKIVLAR